MIDINPKACAALAGAIATLIVLPCQARTVTYGRNASVVVMDGNATGVSGNTVVVVDGKVVAGANAITAAGPVITENRPLAVFDSVRVEAPVEMTYVVSAVPSLTVSAPSNILSVLTSNVAGGQLVIGLAAAVVLHEPIKVAMTGPTPRAFRLNGAVSVIASGLNAVSLTLEISGSGNFTVRGRVERLRVSISGSGDVDATSLRASVLSAHISGSGNIAAYASRSAAVDVSGSGDVVVAGNPAQRSVDRAGSGHVTFQ